MRKAKAGASSPLLSMVEVSTRLGVSVRKCWRLLASDPDFPEPIQIGERGTRFDARAVERYIDRLRRRTRQLASAH